MPAHHATLIEPAEQHLDDLLALSQSAHWNQNRDDWRWMLHHGRTRALRLHDQLVASTLVLPWPAAAAVSKTVAAQPSLAWISMVLVLPEHRGKGYATRLLRESLEWLAEPTQRHLTPLLDATPAGHPVYLKLGFRDQWGFTRWERRTHLGKHPAPATESIVAIADWGINDPHRASVLALDQMAFGADRQQLLDDLVRRAPPLALALRSNDSIRGFAMARPGRQATQLGPLVAHDAVAAIALADCALSRIEGPVFLDVPDSRRDMEPWLDRRGFTQQRAFTRMALIHPGTAVPHGNPSAIFAVAGPELG